VKKLMAIVLAALLLVPLLTAPADAWVAVRGGGGWHGGGWHGHGCCWGGGWGWGGFGAGLAVGTLATAPYWYGPYAYGYPAYPYAYPAYPAYPAYSYPTTPPPAYTPGDSGGMVYPSQSVTVSPGQPAYSPPAPQGSAQMGPQGQSCQTVTVEGHNETRTLQSGQSVTAWVPTHTQQLCQ
jgi:hypothetical protein